MTERTVNSMEQAKTTTPEAGAPQDGGRKPYEPPKILSREPLEAAAGVCAPSPPAKSNPGTCSTGPISS